MNAAGRFITERTWQPPKHWLDLIGTLIVENSKPLKGFPKLSTSNTAGWLVAFTKVISKEVEKRTPTHYDENIAVAKVLSVLLTLWVYRISRAKAYDPRRPIKVRKQAIDRTSQYALLLMQIVTDESVDPVYFPVQEWDPPYSKTARYEPDTAEMNRQEYRRKRKTKRKPK